MKKVRLWALLALTTALFAGLTASPATAGGHAAGGSALCPDDFSSLTALTGTGTARTVAGTEIQREKETELYSGSTEIQKTPGKPTAGTIPVYFHVVYASDGEGYVSPATVEEQIAVLNLSFSGFYEGYGLNAPDTGFRFDLKEITYTQNDGWFAQDTFAQELEMKSALKRGGSSDLNIYSNSGGGYLGWAYYPSIVTSNNTACSTASSSTTARCRAGGSRTTTSGSPRRTRSATTSACRTRSSRAARATATT